MLQIVKLLVEQEGTPLVVCRLTDGPFKDCSAEDVARRRGHLDVADWLASHKTLAAAPSGPDKRKRCSGSRAHNRLKRARPTVFAAREAGRPTGARFQGETCVRVE
jgi:hypothetical protein